MANMAESSDTIEVELPDGTSVNVNCAKEILNLLKDSATGDTVKDALSSLITEKAAAMSVQTKSVWNDATEKLLMHIFKLVDSSKPQKSKWKTVALKVNEHGYNFSAEQCRLKVKSLKEKYDRNKKKVKTSGESPPSDDDMSEVESIFDSLPDMRPTFTIDSGSLENLDRLKPKDQDQPTTSSQATSSQEVSKGEDVGETSTKKKSKNQKRSIEHMIDYLEDNFEKREAATKKRHSEKMELFGSLIDVLKDVAQK